MTTTTTTVINLDDAAVKRAAGSYLSNALARTSLRRPGRQAIVLCPALGPVMTRLAFAVTDVPVNRFTERPQLDAALESGLSAFFSAERPAVNGAGPFLRAAFGRLADLFAIEIHCGSDRWTFQHGEPLGGWLGRIAPDIGPAKRPRISFRSTDAAEDPAVARQTLLEMVAESHELVALNTTIHWVTSAR